MPTSTARPRYHHGDLKQTLITTASEAVERDGWEALSLGSLADAAAVSRSAPYRHFLNRDALLATVAADGFNQLIGGFRALRDQQDALARLRCVSAAILDFADQRPQLFRLMFRSDLLIRAGGPPAELQEAARLAYELYKEFVSEVLAANPAEAVVTATLAAWSMTFGFAVLRAEGRIKPFMHEPVPLEDVANDLIDMLGHVMKSAGRCPGTKAGTR